MQQVPISKRGWDDLTPSEKVLRTKSRKALSEVRSGRTSLEAASREVGIDPETVRRHIDGFVKRDGKWCAKANIRNEVYMMIYSDEETKFIPIPTIRDASTIGRYHNAVKAFLESGDAEDMYPFVGKVIRASDGTEYVLETDPRALYEIMERCPEQEFFSIYGRG